MHKMKRQFGGALITVLMCLVIFGSMGFVGLKLVPIYIEYFGVKSSLESMANQGNLHGKPTSELRTLLTKRLNINDVRRVSKEDVMIKTKPRETTIQVAYEVLVPLVSNVDFLLTFDNTVSLH